MVYNTQDCWVFGLGPTVGVLKNLMFRKLDLFPSSGEGVGDTYSVGSVKKTNSNHWRLSLRLSLSKLPNRVGVPPPSPEDGNRPSLETLCFLEYRAKDQVQKPSNSERKMLLIWLH
jgi:hypothetical protein